MRALNTASLTTLIARNGLQRRRSPPPLCCEPLLFSGYHPSCGSRSRSFGSSIQPSDWSEQSSKEAERVVLGHIQDLIQDLSLTSPAALKELFELSCTQYLKRGTSTSSNTEKALERMDESFRIHGRRIIQKYTDEGSLQDGLLQSFEGCHQSFEILQTRLDDAVHARHRVNDEEVEGDEHLSSLQKTEKEWHGSEAHPWYQRWVMDVKADVDYTELDGERTPAAEKSILLNNLPDPCEEEMLRANLEVCGEIARVEFCHEWKEMLDAHKDSPDTMVMQGGEMVKKPPPKFSLSYALVEFQEPAGRQRATRRLPRLQGILFKETQRVKLSTTWSKQIIGRPCFPQDLRLKKSLLLRGLPLHMTTAEVLRAVLEPLRGLARRCRGVLLNCRAFRVRQERPLQVLEVEDGEVRQEPQAGQTFDVDYDVKAALERCCPEGNGGELVLRFNSFKEAYVSRGLLKGMELGGRAIVVGFPPWRLQAAWTDSRGYDLGEARLMDLPVPRASACYRLDLDPVVSAPTTQEVDAMAQN